MKMLVLGAGLQGSACAYDLLLRGPGVTRVTLADLDPSRIPPFLEAVADERLHRLRLDVTDPAAVAAAFAGHDAACCALPYYFNEPMTRAAIAAGVHFCDLGGNTEIVFQQKGLDAAAREHGVSVVPDCGLAPGMVNILAAEGIRRLDVTDRVRLYVGGLPQHPEPPLNYQIVYSLEGALDYYTTPSWVLRDGRRTEIEPLSELEAVEFPAPVGRLEAFHTAGGISTLPWVYEGKVRVMEYKTLRYPGHADLMRAMRDLGLLGLEPIDVKGQRVVPRDVFIAAVSPRLRRPGGRDLVALRVVVTGTRDGRPAGTSFQLLDYHDADHGLTAMMRCTGFSLAITALLQAQGRVTGPGVRTPDEAVPFGAYVAALAERGVHIEETETAE